MTSSSHEAGHAMWAFRAREDVQVRCFCSHKLSSIKTDAHATWQLCRRNSAPGWAQIGHNTQTRQLDDRKDEPEVKQTGEEFWRARRDSNSRPIAPEAIALSS